jgi:hypothetical protein
MARGSDGASALVAILGLFIALGCAFGAWELRKWFNYKYSYETKVREEIKVMVKPECLRN